MTFRRLTLICLMTQIALCSAFCVFGQTVMGPSPKSTATPPKVIIDPGYHRLQLSTAHAYAQISQDGKFTIYCDHGSLVLDLNTGAMNCFRPRTATASPAWHLCNSKTREGSSCRPGRSLNFIAAATACRQSIWRETG
jgi:hypothetical protein